MTAVCVGYGRTQLKPWIHGFKLVNPLSVICSLFATIVGATNIVVSMVASGISETGSMGARLQGHMPKCHGIVASDKSTGTFVVTTMVATFADNLADMIGGTMAVMVATKEGGVFGGCAGWTRTR